MGGAVAAERCGPLTWYQEMVWWNQYWNAPDQRYPPMSGVFYLARRPRPDEVEAAFRALMDRHEVLRTSVGVGDDGIPVQTVHPAGTVEPPLRTVPLSRFRDGAEEMLGTFGHPGRDSGGHARWRAVLAVKDDRVLAVGFAGDRLLMDGWSVVVVREQLLAVLGGSRTGDVLPQQPLDRAAEERSAAGRAKADAALARLARVFAAAPPSPFPPLARPDDASARYVEGELRSAGMLADVDALCRHGRTTRPSAVLAMLAAVLALRTGRGSCAVRSLAANRSLGRYRSSVQGLYQPAYLVLDLSGDPSAAEVLRRAWRESVDAYRHTEYPADEVRELLVRVERERGFAPWFGLDYDFLPGTPAVRARTARTGAGTPPITHRYDDTGRPGYALFRAQVVDEELVLALDSDTAMIPAAEIDRLLRWTARGLSLAADDPRLSLSQLAGELGIPPVPQGTGAQAGPERAPEAAPGPGAGRGGPPTPAEEALVGALKVTHPLDAVDLALDYVGAGGRLRSVPRVAAELARRGYRGLREEHVGTPMPLRAVAAGLRRDAGRG
ncbi:condensation domain-containing protein [Actinomadura fibrosa]|uniref:Condensation domain-containing protein n=1 Tax=Actinomadura fibrosa TaxID=111802 RepID=A0ABW2XLE6_9ACTN|nr:condensation domain-containing protein [Actinomadura fibrosa]